MLNQKILIPLLCLAGVAGVALYITKQKHAKKTSSQVFFTDKVGTRDIAQFISTSGNLRAKDRFKVGSLVAGKVTQILADDNDIVKKGQILAILDNGIGDSAVKKQRAVVVEAESYFQYQKAFYKRQKALFDAGQLAKNLFEQYTQDLKTSEARFDQARAILDIEIKTYENLFIKSPDDGIVIAKRIDLGQMITSQLDATVLYEIAKDLRHMEAALDVDEADIGNIKSSQDAYFTVDAFPKMKFDGRVKQVEYQAKIVESVVTYLTILDVDNPDLSLRPGMTTNVEIKVADVKGVPCISNKALRVSSLVVEGNAKVLGIPVHKIPDGGLQDIKYKKLRDFVWVLDRNNAIKQVRVDLGVSDGKYTQVISGVTLGEDVIVDAEDINKDAIAMLQKTFGQSAGQLGGGK